jgi:hypothetical protein
MLMNRTYKSKDRKVIREPPLQFALCSERPYPNPQADDDGADDEEEVYQDLGGLPNVGRLDSRVTVGDVGNFLAR